MPDHVCWESVREGEVSVGAHGELAALLRMAYPHFPEHFVGARSWSYLRPELRVIGRDGPSPVATAGVLRRFVEVGGRDQLVGIVGLVAVRPDVQGTGVGGALMGRVEAALHACAVPFGILLTGPRQVSFYRRAGWRQLTPRRVRYLADDTTDPVPVVDEVVGTAFVLPVLAPFEDWPDGEMDWHCASV